MFASATAMPSFTCGLLGDVLLAQQVPGENGLSDTKGARDTVPDDAGIGPNEVAHQDGKRLGVGLIDVDEIPD
jgi:hypothetical protein